MRSSNHQDSTMTDTDHTGHTHVTKDGTIVRCYHACRTGVRNTILSVSFWIGMTIGYPIEHALWESTPLRHLMVWAHPTHDHANAPQADTHSH